MAYNENILTFNNDLSKHIAFMATQYDDVYHTTKSAILEALGDDLIDTLDDETILNEYLEFKAEECDEYYYRLDEDSINEALRGCTADEIVRKTLFGNFKYSHDYFTINIYDNLESCTDWQLIKQAREDSDFKKWVTDCNSDYSVEWYEQTKAQFLHLLEQGY